MDNRLGEIQVFARVVDAGSFSEAARLLRMAPSTISKLISRSEARLGVRLIERSTRRLSLTAEGQAWYDRSVALLAELDQIESELGCGAAQAGGTVRVSTSVPFGVFGVEPLLPAFWAAHPQIVVDLSLSDEIIDLYLDRTDVAFRIGPLQDSTLIARRLGAARRMIVAAPAYLERHGTPKTVDDLARHQCIGFNFRRAVPVWPVRDSGRIVDRVVSGPLLTNNGESARRLAVAGAGLARLGDFHLREDIAAGRLVEVLADVGVGEVEEVHALHLGGPHLPHRVRAFLDFVCPRLQQLLATANRAPISPGAAAARP